MTSFRPLSPDTSKSSFSLARFFQRKRPEARVEVKIDSSKKHRSVSPLVSPRSSPQVQRRASSPLLGARKTSAHGHSAVDGGRGRRPSPAGYRNVHAVLGRLNAAAGGRGQVRLNIISKKPVDVMYAVETPSSPTPFPPTPPLCKNLPSLGNADNKWNFSELNNSPAYCRSEYNLTCRHNLKK